jgi:hypothetical protein
MRTNTNLFARLKPQERILMPKRQSTWMALGAIALVFASCAGNEPAAEGEGAGSKAAETAAAAPHACATVTAADVEEVLGVAAQVRPSDQLQSISTTSLCSYESAQNSQNLVSVMVRVGPRSLDAAANLKQYVDGLKMNMGEDYVIETVEGLSGPALWNPDMKQLTVFKGPSLLILTMSESSGKDLQEAARLLGEKALGRL